ncbi:MAG: ATP-binding protein [Cryomorphaceae bacterium]|nr:ATP-binding protein [Cryomorphaceae bacterium]
MDYIREDIKELRRRLEEEERHFIQVVAGPRQVGKTTIVRQFMKSTKLTCVFASADDANTDSGEWITVQWSAARMKLAQSEEKEIVLIIDEIQRLENWSQIVKREWDADTFNDIPIKVVLLGSSRLLLKKGLNESLAGRFEKISLTHWTYPEMQDAFGFTLDEYIFYGGYPGAAKLIKNFGRWRDYIKNSMVDSHINRDILMLTQVNKPALMRSLFDLGTLYSSKELSLTKVLGHLQDAGNTTTLTHYLELLDSAGLLGGLQKFSRRGRKRASVPKFQVYNQAFLSASSSAGMATIRKDPKKWGQWLESAVGAHLINWAMKYPLQLYYWREKNQEVDFVVVYQEKIIAIEVKSNHKPAGKGMAAFSEQFNPHQKLLVGQSGISPELFLRLKPDDLL